MKADWATAAIDRAAGQGSERSLWAGSPWVRVCVWLLLATGFAARLSPFLDVDGRLYWLLMSEDGYLMQTIARNMALGLGMSTANGTMPTNGVQPLATFLYAGLHALAGGSRMLAIGYVTVFATAVSAAAAGVVWRLGRSVLRDLPFAPDIALLAAALWFASPMIIGHSMNGLETGVYYLAITTTLVYYFSLDLSAAAPMSAGQRVVLGLLFGVAFLARNDAVFFIGAVLVAHVLLGGASAGGGWSRRAVDAVVAGGLSLVVGSPWLIHNKLMFGSVVPISGTAESHSATFGANLRMIPANLIEASLPYARIPRALETAWPVVVVAVLVLAALGWAAWSLVGRRSLRGLRFCVITLVFCIGIAGYYGLFFGAPWFVSRYLSALSPLLCLLSTSIVYLLLTGFLRDRRTFMACGAALTSVLLLVTAGLAVVHFRGGRSNGHRQVVEWVQKNVDERQWIGGIQTGTLGYFHDRTINLDGKVNPKALRAKIEHGGVGSYVLDETPINYLADWVGIASWTSMATEPRFGQAFEVLVEDKAANLGVLRRRVPVIAPD
jgi:hypothetical protein